MQANSLSIGPGGYTQDSEKLKTAAPKFGFGTSTRAESKNRLKVPGPGNYAAKTFTGKDLPSYSMGATINYSPERKEQAKKPGPGNYSPGMNEIKNKEPSYKIGTETRRDLAFEKAKGF